MKDLHSHILMGIDDGSKEQKESLEILKKAEKEGITDIMLTPHYIKNTNWSENNLGKQNKLAELKEEIIKNNIKINLYLGNEVYIDEELLKLIKEGEIATLNGTRYILIELPLMNELQNTKEILFNLVTNNYIPIIAHPERYHYIQTNPEKIEEYLEMGALLQGNYQSLLGKYGQKAKTTLKILLKNNKIQFLASDIHRKTDEYYLKKTNKKLEKLIKNKKTVEDLLDGNFEKVINNEIISI